MEEVAEKLPMQIAKKSKTADYLKQGKILER